MFSCSTEIETVVILSGYLRNGVTKSFFLQIEYADWSFYGKKMAQRCSAKADTVFCNVYWSNKITALIVKCMLLAWKSQKKVDRPNVWLPLKFLLF
jgi:hypothetical protein